MAVDEKDGEGGQPTASGTDWTKLSEFYPYGDAPPRLAAALNDTLTDAPEGTVFENKSKPKAKTSKKDPPETASPMETPQKHEVQDLYQASVVEDILNWVAYRLDLGLSAVWLSQVAQVLEWSPDGGAEEGWAEAIMELFLGVTYSGPAQTYNFGGVYKRDGAGALVDDKDDKLGSWERTIYRRIERKQWIKKGDRYSLRSWEDPIPFEEDGEEDNTDPAIPIGVACQHMTTYGVLSRGFTLDSMGNGTYPGVGLMASDANWSDPLFGGKGYDKLPLAKADSMGGVHLPKPAPPPPPKPAKAEGEAASKPDDKPPPPPPESTVAYYLDVNNALQAGFGPGSIAIYDTDRGTDQKSHPTLYMTVYEKNKYGDDAKIYGQYFKTRQSDEHKSGFGSNWTVENRPTTEAETDIAACESAIAKIEAKEKKTKTDEQNLEIQKKRLDDLNSKKGTDVLPRTPVTYPGTRQYDGSHIYGVLRKHPTKPMVQLLDVNMKNSYQALEATGSESVMFEAKSAIVDSESYTHLYDENHAFGGLGVLPEHEVDQAQVDFLRKARPVGLGRIAITKRVLGSKMTDADVLYVGRLMRMYGDSPDKNYWISRLLWSLRNTPGFTNVAVWWFVYAPRGLLAKCMWAHGAREMKLTDYVEKYGEINSGHLLLNNVMTNLGAPPRAGHATLYCRYKSNPDGKNTVTFFSPQKPPSALMRYMDPQKMPKPGLQMPSLAWDATYTHPKITVDDSKLPTLFQAGT